MAGEEPLEVEVEAETGALLGLMLLSLLLPFELLPEFLL